MNGKYLTDESYRNVRAFLQTMTSVCKSCTRRMPSNCGRCDLENVERVLQDLDNSSGELPPAEHAEKIRGFMPRVRHILRQLIEHGPCRSCEIDIGEYGTRQAKWKALHILARNGLVVISRSPFNTTIPGGGGYAYDVNRERMETIERIVSRT